MGDNGCGGWRWIMICVEYNDDDGSWCDDDDDGGN